MDDRKKLYDQGYSNLVKSATAIPVHLQPAKGALAWWEEDSSLMAKATMPWDDKDDDDKDDDDKDDDKKSDKKHKKHAKKDDDKDDVKKAIEVLDATSEELHVNAEPLAASVGPQDDVMKSFRDLSDAASLLEKGGAASELSLTKAMSDLSSLYTR